MCCIIILPMDFFFFSGISCRSANVCGWVCLCMCCILSCCKNVKERMKRASYPFLLIRTVRRSMCFNTHTHIHVVSKWNWANIFAVHWEKKGRTEKLSFNILVAIAEFCGNAKNMCKGENVANTHSHTLLHRIRKNCYVVATTKYLFPNNSQESESNCVNAMDQSQSHSDKIS